MTYKEVSGSWWEFGPGKIRRGRKRRKTTSGDGWGRIQHGGSDWNGETLEKFSQTLLWMRSYVASDIPLDLLGHSDFIDVQLTVSL